ncbi:MAG: 16S rRNA (cytosine(1402)-N(4))-methyltransferase RsmH [Candidatus Sungbacteria bacterium]|nr:16S rRNA (cytosine(1402)-N(4))-methyltransferase RsmH [Candidatus Sungbacteria bacterium]
MEEIHKPVLLKEVVEVLNPQQGETYLDGTINGGGHAAEILKRVGKGGKVIGFDWDCGLVARLREKYASESDINIVFECANYADAKDIFIKHQWVPVHGVLLDLGFSSYHVEKSGRGFSFRADEPLDMRYSLESGATRAGDIINTWSEERIESLLRDYGGERMAGRIAHAIVRERAKKSIKTSSELSKIIEESVPYSYRKGRIHCATRTFQALRIAVNSELENISRFLETAEDLLQKNGKIAIISFHSLEDRIIKNFFKKKAKEGVFTIINKKVIRATREEKKANPRARSAKLRAAIKV